MAGGTPVTFATELLQLTTLSIIGFIVTPSMEWPLVLGLTWLKSGTQGWNGPKGLSSSHMEGGIPKEE